MCTPAKTFEVKLGEASNTLVRAPRRAISAAAGLAAKAPPLVGAWEAEQRACGHDMWRRPWRAQLLIPPKASRIALEDAQGSPARKPFPRLGLCRSCTLNARGQSRLTLSLRQEPLRAVCGARQGERGPRAARKRKGPRPQSATQPRRRLAHAKAWEELHPRRMAPGQATAVTRAKLPGATF